MVFPTFGICGIPSAVIICYGDGEDYLNSMSFSLVIFIKLMSIMDFICLNINFRLKDNYLNERMSDRIKFEAVNIISYFDLHLGVMGASYRLSKLVLWWFLIILRDSDGLL